jgi:hypothetical protein
MNAANGWAERPDLDVSFISATAKCYTKGSLRLIFDDAEVQADGLWRHGSVSCHHRYPTWNEILDVRYTFFGPQDDVFQVLPPKSEYVNLHKNCFHLWSPIGRRVVPK